jgi:hypothetical protein
VFHNPARGLSDRDCSVFEKGLSIGSERCLYLGRWTSPIGSGKQSASTSPDLSWSARPRRVAGRGAIRATSCTGSSGCCARVRRGRTCPGATRRTRPAFAAFRSGSARECSTGSLRPSLETYSNEGRSISARRSSTAPTRGQKKGSSCWTNSTRQGDQDHGSGRPPWPSYRRRDCEW